MAKLKIHHLEDSKIIIYQTIKAINNSSEIQVLQKQIDDLKIKLDKIK